MGLTGNVITAVVAVLGVALGGWLTRWNQDRSWHKEHARQWRDIRLSAYVDFLSAYREYISFALEPTASISTRPHPRLPGELMPYFDEAGRPYKERLEAKKTAVRLVSELPATTTCSDYLVRRARRVAAARGVHAADDIPHEDFQELWAAERQFLAAARKELGLPEIVRPTE